MATINLQIQSKKSPVNIFIRLSLGAGKDIKRKTGYIIDVKDWNQRLKEPKQSNEDLINLVFDLNQMKAEILNRLNHAARDGVYIDGIWLEEQINAIRNVEVISDDNSLVTYFDKYIKHLSNKVNIKGLRGAAETTKGRYRVVKNKIIAYQTYTNKKYTVRSVDSSFMSDFVDYLEDVDNLATNTIGRYIKFVKTICLYAKEQGIEVSPQLKFIKGFTEKKTSIVSFTKEDLKKIKEAKFKKPEHDNARDWLIVGCQIGQRVSDLLFITKDNIVTDSKMRLLKLTQQKTGKEVLIPLNPEVEGILKKRKGQFPRYVNSVKFNVLIKDVARIAKIKQPTYGSRRNPDTNRKEVGTFEKWQLVSSHVCRRTFATLHYGEVSTSTIMQITAHGSEKMLMEYIGKTNLDYAKELSNFWGK